MAQGLRWSEEELRAYQLRHGNVVREHHEPISVTSSASELPESQLLARVRELAKLAGWLCYHTHDSRMSEEGFPDLVLTNGERILFVELKSCHGKLKEQQALWLEMLRHTHRVEVYIWRPADVPLIMTLLQQKDEQRHNMRRPSY